MPKKRVLEVNKLYAPHIGGVETVVQQLAEGMSRRDELDVTVLCCVPKGRGRVDYINGVKVVRAGSLGLLASMPVSLPFIFMLRRMAREADVIHLHMPFPLGDLALLLSGFKGRVVASWHSDVVRQKALMKLYKPVLRRFLRRADVIIAATQNHIEYSEHLNKARDKCAVVPYGVDPAQYDASPHTQSGLSRALYSGRLVYYKGVDVLLSALALTENIALDIVGEGPLESALRAKAERLNIAHRVRFLGKLSREALNRAFHECDFLVLPSVAKSEAFGLVQLEAMASGKPVINTNLPSGVPLVSLDGVTGVTVPPGDSIALAQAMTRLAGDEALREAYGAAALERVLKNFTLEAMCGAVIKLL